MVNILWLLTSVIAGFLLGSSFAPMTAFAWSILFPILWMALRAYGSDH